MTSFQAFDLYTNPYDNLLVADSPVVWMQLFADISRKTTKDFDRAKTNSDLLIPLRSRQTA